MGRTVDFKNTIIIMTSNIGSHYLLDGLKDDGTIDQNSKDLVEKALESSFRPEFLNRIDDIVMFNPLTSEQVYKIIDLQIAEIQKRLDHLDIKLEITGAAKEYILAKAYDVEYGARPVKRFLQTHVETELGKMIIEGNIIEKDTAILDVDENKELKIRKK